MNEEQKRECKKPAERSYEPNEESLRAIREADEVLASGSYTTYLDAESLLEAAFADSSSSE